MASENKLLGVLQLKADGVLATIDQVNAKLKSLGQGVDLDLTKIVNAKVNTQLENLKRQIDEVSKAATASTKAQADAIQQAAQLRVDQLKALQELEKHKTHDTEWNRLQAKVTQTSRAYQDFIKDMSSKDLEKALGVDKVIKAQEKLDSLVNTTRDKALQKTQEEVAKVQARGLEMQVESARKAAQEQQEIRRQQLLADVEASKKETEATLKAIDEKHAAYQKEQEMYATGLEQRVEDARKAAQAEQKATDESYKNYIANQKAYHEEAAKAEEAYYNQVRDARLNIINLEKQLANANLGTAQKTTINQQLADAKQVYSEYAEAVRNQVEADASVVRNLGELAIAESRKLDQEAAQMAQKAQQASMQAEQMANRLIMVVGRFSLQLLREQWQGAVDYAMEYYDALNEIRVVTGMTEAESRTLGASFRQMAQEMSVTSTEIASAAVTFYRQGLNDTQVKSRLEWVTKYAKVASISFESAAELITASANAMSEDIQGDIQRVVDVFLYLGDNAATTGEEVGKAMQKASASATEFGVSFEWLGSWIATVSEQTRQAPETIGNAFNSMMARLHSIRATGYNSEDEVNINQVAKALATVNVQLMDQEGNWRDMTDIFNEVAEQWDSMTGKQKSYIATTVAGVRQQNVFFALMNDLSKGIENGSRAWELYTGALKAAGTATEKYATWQESLAASQANLTNSLEALYANLEPTLIKGFYETMSWLIDGLNTLAGPTGFVAVAAAIGVFTAAIIKAGGAIKATSAAFATHPLFATATLIVGILALGAVIGGFVNDIQNAGESYEELTERMESADSRIQKLTKAQATINSSLTKIQDGVSLTSAEMSEYNSALSEVSSLSPTASSAVDGLTSKMGDQTKAAKDLNQELDTLIKNEKDYSAYSAQVRFGELKLDSNVAARRNSGGLTDSEILELAKLFGYNEGDTSSFGKAMVEISKAFESNDYTSVGIDKVLDNGMTVRFSDDLNLEIVRRVADIVNQVIISLYENSRIAEAYSEDIATEKDIGLIGSTIWSMLFGADGDATSFSNLLADTADQWVQAAMDVVTRTIPISGLQKDIAASMMKDILIGENGVLEYEDFSESTKSKMQTFINALIEDVDTALDNQNVVNYISNRLFGKTVEEMYPDYRWAHRIKEGSWVQDFVELYTTALEAGFNEVDLADILKGPLSNYAKSWNLNSFMDYLQSSIEIPDDFWEKLIFGDGTTIDSATKALIYRLVSLGTEVSDIEKVFSQSDSLEDFKEGLEAVKKEAEDTGITFEDAMKNVTNSLSYIDKIDALLKSINEDKTYDADKLLEITKTNPEILAAAGSVDTLRVALEALRDTQLTELRKQYTDLVSSIEDVDPEDVEAVVDALMSLQTAKPQESDKTNFIEAIANTKDTLDDIQSLIDKINDDENVTFDDLWGLKDAHPELMLLIGDEQKLKAALEDLQKVDTAALHQAVVGWAGSTEAIAQASPFGDYLTEEIRSLNSLRAEAEASGDYTLLQEIDDWLNQIADDAVAAAEKISTLTPEQKTLASNIEDLDKAKSYLEALDSTKDGYTAAKALEAFEGLKKIFPELSAYDQVTESFLADANQSVEELGESVDDALSAIGITTDETAKSASEAAKAVEELTDAIAAYHNELAVKQASQSGFSTQVSELSSAFATQDKQATQKLWDSYTDEMQKAIEDAYPEMVNAMREWLVQTTPPEVPELQAKVDANAATFKTAESNYHTAEKEVAKAQADYETAKQRYESAAADYKNAEQQYNAAVENITQQYGSVQYARSVEKSRLSLLPDAFGGAQTFEEALALLNNPDYRSQQPNIPDYAWDARVAEMTGNIERGRALTAIDDAGKEVQTASEGVDSAAANLLAAEAKLQAASEAMSGASSSLEEASSSLSEAEANLQEVAGPEQKAMENYAKSLKDAQKVNATKYFKNTAKATKDLKVGIVNAADAYADFYTEAEKAVTAQSEYLTATDKMADGAEVASDDIKTLAEYLGYATPDALLENWDQVGPLLAAAINEGTDALNRLNEAAFINITGVSSADFSNIMNGLLAVQDEAEETVQKLLATGQWTIEEQDVDQSMPIWLMGAGGKITYQEMHATAKYKLLKPTGKNPFGGAASTYSGAGTSSGGGGGGGSSSKGMTEVERMLDRMAQIQDIQDHVKSLYSAQAKLFEQTGQLQGVIQYYEKERSAIEQQNKTLQANLDEMEPWLEKKRAEVAALDVASSEYEEASSDLKALQERHQQYTLALINNTAEIDKLTESIKEQRDAIRQMEIDLRNTILDAIKDREALNKRMLEGTIETENTILDLIKKRYEKERDMILENTEKQISALEEERDLLSEQLELRKQQAEEEDKAAKLAELEAKYARIVADPTRQKEALSIQNQIKDLRDEMAWDLAEKEVKAQQDSIDQQIDSLEDYKEYTENYYEYLFAHPQQLIDEMKEIMKGADDEIIAWLIANDEEYAEATEATKQKTEDSWREMLRDMRGELELFWDEVEEIIAGGDDYIINFLKENSAAYREAGQLQAEAYVDEWKKQLEDLRKAYEEVVGGIEPYDYTYIAPAEGNNKSGGGGPDGSPTVPANQDDELPPSKFAVLPTVVNIGDATFVQETNRQSVHGSLGDTTLLSPLNVDKNKLGTIKKFGTGGIAGSDGLAWVDDKERILTPYQTELFESLMASLDSMSRRITVPGMPLIGDVGDSSGSPINFGDIIVNVETLDSDADYEELAQKVLDTVTEKMNRGSVVGGIRYTR